MTKLTMAFNLDHLSIHAVDGDLVSVGAYLAEDGCIGCPGECVLTFSRALLHKITDFFLDFREQNPVGNWRFNAEHFDGFVQAVEFESGPPVKVLDGDKAESRESGFDDTDDDLEDVPENYILVPSFYVKSFEPQTCRGPQGIIRG